MIYVAVTKNESGEFEILKTLTSVINQRSHITGTTIGNVTYLDAAGRLEHGFWEQEDLYIGTGEFKEFDRKEVEFDDVDGRVTNSYFYKLMDLAVIRDEMKNRVRSYRSQLSSSQYTKDTKVYDITSEGRLELQGLVLESLLDSSIQSVSMRLPSGEDIELTVTELKALYLEIALYRDGLYDTEAQIISAIDQAADYDAIRAAAVWGDQPL